MEYVKYDDDQRIELRKNLKRLMDKKRSHENAAFKKVGLVL